MVGEFDKKGLYQPIQAVGQLSYSSAAYAAQTYFYEPGKPVIRLAWNRSEIPGAPFNGSMCTPMEMTLRNIGGRYYLCAHPVEGVESLVRKRDAPGRAKRCAIMRSRSAPRRAGLRSRRNPPHFPVKSMGLTFAWKRAASPAGKRSCRARRRKPCRWRSSATRQAQKST